MNHANYKVKKVLVEKVTIRKHKAGWTIQEGISCVMDENKVYAYNSWNDLIAKLKFLIGYGVD